MTLDEMAAEAAGDDVLEAMVARARARAAESGEAGEAALWARLRLGSENPRRIYRTRAEIEADAEAYPPLAGLAQRQLDHLDAGTKTVAEACAFWTEVRASHVEIA